MAQQIYNPLLLLPEDDGLFPLPREFQVIKEGRVPLLQLHNNDKNNQNSNNETSQQTPLPHPHLDFEDFILVAEFSELEGPIPLAIIPDRVAPIVQKQLCLNTFAVHLMTTDYQVNHGNQFKLTKDTQVLRKNVFQDVHVFMQYFCLLDIKARGFVRPFCYGYVTLDHVKLESKLGCLMEQFDEITRVLKHINRLWFIGEIEQYLQLLKAAKESFLLSKPEVVADKEDEDEERPWDGDPRHLTLKQIAHQYSEIGNIHRTAKIEDPQEPEPELNTYTLTLMEQVTEKSSLLNPDLLPTLDKVEILYDPEGDQKSISCLQIPLAHPLKAKSEPLRPLTILGQIGTLDLIWRLSQLQEEHRKDHLLIGMEGLSLDFREHCRMIREEKRRRKGGGGESSNSGGSGESAKEEKLLKYHTFQGIEKLLSDPSVPVILEKIHDNVPRPVGSCSSEKSNGNSDDKSQQSGSYHTVSEQESEQDVDTEVDDLPTSTFSIRHERTRRSLESFSSSCDSPLPVPSTEDEDLREERIIQRKPWWEYLERVERERGGEGYGILRFFRHYGKVAPHIVYSLLLGRPLTICGREEQKGKISRILNSLLPLVFDNRRLRPNFKVLKWHRGILVKSHLQEYKLIGLCVPERLSVHDLIHSRDQNDITIWNISEGGGARNGRLLGPAYSGEFLEEIMSVVPSMKSDLAFLAYLGSVWGQLETRVFMVKALQEKERNRKKFVFGELVGSGWKSSDLEIVRYICGITSGGVEGVLDVF